MADAIERITYIIFQTPLEAYLFYRWRKQLLWFSFSFFFFSATQHLLNICMVSQNIIPTLHEEIETSAVLAIYWPGLAGMHLFLLAQR